MGSSLWDGLQFGGSFSYANVDRNNVNIEAKTTGLTTFFDVASSAKFNIIREAKSQTRYGAELAWNYGPLLAWGEYINVKFSDVQTSSDQFNINVTDYYGALLWMVTGERPSIKDGKIQPIRPSRNLWQGGWGALGLAFRYDSFDAGDDAYKYLINKGDSVREATAYTIALNWYLNPYVRCSSMPREPILTVPCSSIGIPSQEKPYTLNVKMYLLDGSSFSFNDNPNKGGNNEKGIFTRGIYVDGDVDGIGGPFRLSSRGRGGLSQFSGPVPVKGGKQTGSLRHLSYRWAV